MNINSPQAGSNKLFPVFLKLEELNVLLVGGGNVALEKLSAILSNAPATRIYVVALVVKSELVEFIGNYPRVTFIKKEFQINDLTDRDIAIIAVNNKEISSEIYKAAKLSGVLVNVADTPELCDFYLGAVVQKGQLKIGISTNGKSPTMAKRLREVFESAIPDDINDSIENLGILRSRLNGNFNEKVKRMNAFTELMVREEKQGKEIDWKRIAMLSLKIFGLMLVGHFVFSYLPLNAIALSFGELYQDLDRNFGWMVLAGFLAQLVDGALGMGYGVTSASILLSTGVNLASISGSIHTAEMFASGASGYNHYKFGNVNIKLFRLMVIPAVIGAILGAVLLSVFGDTHTPFLRPLMAIYTSFLGIRILTLAFRKPKKQQKFRRYRLLAWVGGFLDSFGGGGWGPIVTSTLITKGRNPKYVIGSVSLTEFFVTLASAFTFFTILGVSHWQVIIALIIGGLIAAPVAARLTGKLPKKASFILLGILVIVWSFRIIINSL